MKTSRELRELLNAVNHKSYPAYKALAGKWKFEKYVLGIDHVQGDPFASPSSLHVEISCKDTGFPFEYYKKDCYRIALQDFLTRRFEKEVKGCSFQAKGSGKSGLLSVSHCGQRVLERSACQITDETIILRFHVGFPAFGRTIAANELEKILFGFLPKCLDNSLFFQKMNKSEVEKALYLAEDQEVLRKVLKEEHLVAFVANGAMLPRKDGISQMPLRDGIPFISPASLERTFILPHKGEIKGMAIREGITLIIGGGYHGKSTLLEAIQDGVYNHIAGDGREYVVTEESAVKLRAENGRSIKNVDISLFINGLPNKKDTKCFSTANASGSTSQAAGAVEAMEADSKLFLIDEDTSATNFLLRDDFMQEVISREKEPITPFLERARDLYEKAGISTILVAGVSGAFFYIADTILQIDSYCPFDITQKVKDMCKEHKAPRTQAPDFQLPCLERSIVPDRKTMRGRDNGKIKTFGKDSFSIDHETIDVRFIEQIIDEEQVKGLAYLLRFWLEHASDGRKSVQEIEKMLSDLWREKGWEAFSGSYVPCGLAMPRKQEIMACISRLRG